MQALSSIELARQSRIAANRAYLAGLHLSPTAMTGGLVEPVGAGSSLVLRAARLLADKAAITEARAQVTFAALFSGNTCFHLQALAMHVYPMHSMPLYRVPRTSHFMCRLAAATPVQSPAMQLLAFRFVMRLKLSWSAHHYSVLHLVECLHVVSAGLHV